MTSTASKSDTSERIYEFSYRNIEGDTFSSDEYGTKAEALAEIKRLIESGEATQIIETWIYVNNNFKGRFNF